MVLLTFDRLSCRRSRHEGGSVVACAEATDAEVIELCARPVGVAAVLTPHTQVIFFYIFFYKP